MNKANLKNKIRHIFEFFGCGKYSRMGKNNMDTQLAAYLPDKGVFIEAGGFDGIYASNTYYLEKIKHWTGILIEPVPEYYEKCRKIRKRSRVFNCALTEDSDATPFLHLDIKDSASSIIKEQDGECVKVKAEKLSDILDRTGISNIDFFSLDVEGFELEVLKGLDFTRHRPAFILVEALNQEMQDKLTRFLNSNKYSLIDQLSHRDFLFKDETVSTD